MTYNQAIRDLRLRGTISLMGGGELMLTEDMIASYSVTSTTGGEGLPIGGTEAASFTLQLHNPGHLYTPTYFDGAIVRMEIGILTNGNYVYSPFGVWKIAESSAPEQDVLIHLDGYDALAYGFSAKYKDNKSFYPTTIGSLVQAMCAVAGVLMKRTNFPNAAVSISKMPSWRKDVTARDIISYCATAAGGFAYMTSDGKLDIRGFQEGEAYQIGSDLYHTLTPEGGNEFRFNAILMKKKEDDEDYTRFAVNEEIADGPTTAIQVDYNPIMNVNIASSVRTELTGLWALGGILTFGGDPAILPGDFITATDLQGGSHKLMATQIDFVFDGGMVCTITSDMPSASSVTCASYDTGSSAFDQNGNIEATRVNGLDTSVVSATNAYFQNLNAQNIMTDTLMASFLQALRIRAEQINTTVATTDDLTATVARIVNATVQKLLAGIVTTDELYAAFAEINAAKIGSLDAESIETDTLAAAFATFLNLHTAELSADDGTIKRLISDVFMVKDGLMTGTIAIENLDVNNAMIQNGVLNTLVIKGEDGRYYQLSVNENNSVFAVDATNYLTGTYTGEELLPGAVVETEDGLIRQIIETRIDVQQLVVMGQLQSARALISNLIADTINVTELFARNAMITALKTARISAEMTLEIMAGLSEVQRAWFTFSNTDGFIVRKPAYTDENDVYHPASKWYTQTSHDSYNIWNDNFARPILSCEKDRVISPKIQIGSVQDLGCITVRKSRKGGWVWGEE